MRRDAYGNVNRKSALGGRGFELSWALNRCELIHCATMLFLPLDTPGHPSLVGQPTRGTLFSTMITFMGPLIADRLRPLVVGARVSPNFSKSPLELAHASWGIFRRPFVCTKLSFLQRQLYKGTRAHSDSCSSSPSCI